MISKEEMIKVIYEKMTDKTLMVWSKIIRLLKNWEGKEDIILEKKSEVLYRTDLWYLHLKDNSWDYEIKNPVKIWDILNYCNNNWINCAIWNSGRLIWNRKEAWTYFEIQFDDLTKSIELQSEKCIEYVYNLIKNRLWTT